MREKTVFIIHPHSNLLFNVSLNLLVHKLLDRGFRLVLFTNCQYSAIYFKDHDKVEIKTLPLFYPRAPRRPHILFKKTILPWLRAKMMLLKHKDPKFICIDPEGFHTAFEMFPHAAKKFNYISFEIFFLSELKEPLRVKSQKRTISLVGKGISSLVIPDKYRLKMFLEEHVNHHIKDIFLIPVSPSKTLIPKGSAAPHHKINPTKGLRSVIYSGSLYDWSGIKDIIRSIRLIKNPSFHFYIHSHGISTALRNDLELFIERCQGDMPIEILNIDFEYRDYLAFLKQFDIGLATYIPYTSDSPYDGKNFAEIGYSSSKFNTLMMLGIPTITTKNKSFEDLKLIYDFGYIIQDLEFMEAALNHIAKNLEHHGAEAEKLYNEILDPENSVQNFVDHLASPQIESYA